MGIPRQDNELARAVEESIQPKPTVRAESQAVGLTRWLTVWAAADDCPVYWSPSRDVYLREFARKPGNDLLAGALSTVVAKVATTSWSLEGPERLVNFWRRNLLSRSDFGAGWSTMIQKWTFDYLTQDMGGAFERVRPIGQWDGACLGLNHLDVETLSLTGNPFWPAEYYPTLAGDEETDPDKLRGSTLNRSQLIHVSDNPSPSETRYNIGYCAVSRALTISRILMDVARYERERLSDLPPAGLLLLNNLSETQWQDMNTKYLAKEQRAGNEVWRQIMVAFGLDPAFRLTADILSFSQLPEHFDRRTQTEIAVYSIALAMRIDPREIWPVSSGTLGTASEANIMHLKARAKGPGLILHEIERSLNDGLTIPESVIFAFDFQDAEEDMQSAEIALTQAKFLKELVDPGVLSKLEARQWLVKQGLFDEDDLFDEDAIMEPETVAPVAPAGTMADEGAPAADGSGANGRTASAAELARSTSVDMGPRVRLWSDGRRQLLQKGYWAGYRARGPSGRSTPPRPLDGPAPVSDTERILRSVARDYAAGLMGPDVLADNVIAAEIERRARDG